MTNSKLPYHKRAEAKRRHRQNKEPEPAWGMPPLPELTKHAQSDVEKFIFVIGYFIFYGIVIGAFLIMVIYGLTYSGS